MDFGFSTEQQKLRQDLLAFIKDHVTEDVIAEMDAAEDEMESSGQSRALGHRGPLVSALYEKIAERGWFGYSYPKEYGGGGGDRVSQNIIEEELLRVGINIGLAGSGAPAIMAAGTEEQKKLREFLANTLGKKVREDSGLGIKPISEFGSKRLVRAAINYAIKNKCKNVTIVHKGNIMKFTEGAFRDWGYEVAKTEFRDQCVTWDECNGNPPAGKILVKDAIADNMFQQALLRPDEYEVLACTNLNGDYLSDALAAQVGGLGIAPGANIGDGYALFEATHGTAPKYAGQDKVNPGSVILSGNMMFEYLGWNEVVSLIEKAFEKTLAQKVVTYDFARQLPGAKEVKCSEFAKAIISNM